MDLLENISENFLYSCQAILIHMGYIHQKNNRNSLSFLLLSLPILPKVRPLTPPPQVFVTQKEFVPYCTSVFPSRLLNQSITCALPLSPLRLIGRQLSSNAPSLLSSVSLSTSRTSVLSLG